MDLRCDCLLGLGGFQWRRCLRYGLRVTDGGMVGLSFVNSELWRYVKNGCVGGFVMVGWIVRLCVFWVECVLCVCVDCVCGWDC